MKQMYTILNQCHYASLQSPSHWLFQITNLMYNSFIFQQYVSYTTLLNMFRTARCSSSGRQIVSPQPLVSSPSLAAVQYAGWERTAIMH